MEHEVDHPALIDAAERARVHAQIGNILGQKGTCGREEQRERAREHQRQPGQRQQRAAITDQRRKKPFRLDSGWNGRGGGWRFHSQKSSLTGSIPSPLK